MTWYTSAYVSYQKKKEGGGKKEKEAHLAFRAKLSTSLGERGLKRHSAPERRKAYSCTCLLIRTEGKADGKRRSRMHHGARRIAKAWKGRACARKEGSYLILLLHQRREGNGGGRGCETPCAWLKEGAGHRKNRLVD